MKKFTRVFGVIFTLIFIIAMPIVLLFTDVQLVAFNENYYKEQYKKYDIEAYVGIEENELMGATQKLLDYIDGKRDDLDFTALIKGENKEFFSDRDKLHMIDVKNLFVSGKKIRNLLLIYIILFIISTIFYIKKWYRSLAKYSIYIFIAGILPIVILIFLMSTDFNKYFTIFHHIFFNNDLWLLDPNKDMLVNIFPESFFFDTAFRIGYYYIAELLALLAFGVFYQKKSRKNEV